MLPRSLLSCRRRRDGLVVPDYLGPHDYPWLRALLDEYDRFAGKPQRELERRLREPLTPAVPVFRLRRAVRVLDRASREQARPAVKPSTVREAAFTAAASRPGDSSAAVLADVAETLGVDEHTLRDCLFADLPTERRVAAPPSSLTPLGLALEVNLALAQGLLRTATEVRLELCGNARSVVRLARLRGLLCVVERPADRTADAVISVSGPLALFRKTLVYGRALAALVPGLAWCNRFRLQARCLIDDQTVPIEVRSGDPIFPAKEPRRFDSRLEQGFARDFARAAPDWEVIREPEPIETPGALIFPDFVLAHRRDPRRRWLLEIVGFWTEDYLCRKIAGLRAAGVANLIVCVDAARFCGRDELSAFPAVIRFRRKIDPRDVLQIIAPAPNA